MNGMSNTGLNKKSQIGSALIWSLMSFALPASVMALIMAVCGIAPFGNGTLVNNANAAWFESFDGMYRSVISGEGVFYHLNVGFGTSFYSEFASGLCSPFLFISLFFGQRSLAAAYTVITVVRTGAAGTAAWYMLRKCTSLNGAMCFALSCGYSLCGFGAFAVYCPSVADGAVFFPLLAAGIYGYVYNSRPVRLFVFGTLFFITCSRLSLLGIVVSFALYAAFYFRRGSKRQRVYKLAMFSATLLCSAAVNLLLLIPVWFGSVNYKNGVFSDVRTNDIVSDLCFGGYGTYPVGGIGLCLAGLLIVGFFAFFFNKDILSGEKIAVSLGSAAVIVCHTVAPMAKYTLGFGNAGGEYISAGFMLTLIAVYCTARVCTEGKGLKTAGIVLPVVIYGLLAGVSLAMRFNDAFSLIAECGLGVFSCAVFVQLFVSSDEGSVRMSAVTAAALALFGAVHCVGAVSGVNSEVTAGRLSFISESRIRSRVQMEKIYAKKNEEIPRFYRTRSTDGVSDSVDINRNDVAGLTEFAEKLGIMRASLYGGADNFTEFTDILFSIAQTDYGFYSKEDAGHKACSPAYLIGNWNNVIPEGKNAFELQNYLAEKWFGSKLFEQIEATEHTTELSSESSRYKWTFGNETTVVDKYVFELPEKAHLYMLVADRDYAFAVNSDARSDWQKGCAGGIFSISREAGTVTLYVSADSADGSPEPVFMISGEDINSEALPKCADYISYRGSTIRFLFDISQDQTAITSIPYEEGWDITVNGRSVAPIKLCGGLIGLTLEEGKNSVVMTYTPPYFRISMWLSAIFMVIGLYLTLKVEHAAAQRRKVRMAFRAVELNISRMTVDELGNSLDETDGKEENEKHESDVDEENEKSSMDHEAETEESGEQEK